MRARDDGLVNAHRRRWWRTAAPRYAVLLLALSACGGQATRPAPPPSQPTPAARSPAAPASPAPTASVPVSIQLAESRYGRIIVDGSGRALYLFDADTDERSTCYTACAAAWPPFITSQTPVAGPDLAPALTSTTVREDGARQVTYNRHPLYFYVGDRRPGEVNCQAAVEYGGGWYVLDGQGNRI